jgi:branched-subunit amino acid aminotransferase/4-amino-4-deoxychorismate lyase
MTAGVGCISINGRLASPHEASVSALDHGFLFGDGVFETLRIYDGRPFRLEKHLERLEAAIGFLEIRGAPDRARLESEFRRTVERSGLENAQGRITVTRGVGARGLDPSGCEVATVVMSVLPLRPYPDDHYVRGIAATLLWPRHSADHPGPALKSTSFQRNVLGKAETARRRAVEGFFLDERGNVTEGTVSNLFILSHGALITPPDSSCLPGITRAEVIELARDRDLPTRLMDVSPELLSGAEEVFVTSSLAELLPVVSIDGRLIGKGTPGPVYRTLLSAYGKRARGA